MLSRKRHSLCLRRRPCRRNVRGDGARAAFRQTYGVHVQWPGAVPRVTLPAGQYQFRRADPTTGADVVQVLNADGTLVLRLDEFVTRSFTRIPPCLDRRRHALGLFHERTSGWDAASKRSAGYEKNVPNSSAERHPGRVCAPVLLAWGNEGDLVIRAIVDQKGTADEVVQSPVTEFMEEFLSLIR